MIEKKNRKKWKEFKVPELQKFFDKRIIVSSSEKMKPFHEGNFKREEKEREKERRGEAFEEGEKEKERRGGAKARQRPRQYTRVHDRDGGKRRKMGLCFSSRNRSHMENTPTLQK